METMPQMGGQPKGLQSETPPPPEAPENKEVETDVNKRREALLKEADKTIELIKSTLSKRSFAKFTAKRAREFENKFQKENPFGTYGDLGGLFDYANEQELQRMKRVFDSAETPAEEETLYYNLMESIKNRKQDVIVGMHLVDEGLKLTKDRFSQNLMVVTSMMGHQANGSENDLNMLIDYIKEKLAAGN